MSEPGSPAESHAGSSEVPTEPLNHSERQLVHEYMSRRQHFLSDYERYNPVQNMQMLANHVFDLSENIYRLKDDFTSSRRMLDIVAANQRDENESIINIGEDLGGLRSDVATLKAEELGGLRHDVATLKKEMDDMRRETQQGFQELKAMMAMLAGVRGN